MTFTRTYTLPEMASKRMIEAEPVTVLTADGWRKGTVVAVSRLEGERVPRFFMAVAFPLPDGGSEQETIELGENSEVRW